MMNVRDKFKIAFWFTLEMGNNFVTLKSDPPTDSYEPRYRILHSGMLFDNDTKVAVKCSNYPSKLKLVDVEDVVFPDKFLNQL
jgi:hypothetical protein